ncbi:Synaptobrevin-like protein [Globisporangium polare]
MKIVSIQLLRQAENGGEPVILSAAYEVSSFGYFQRSGVREMINFFSKTFIKRTGLGVRQSIQHEEYMCHVYVRRDGISGIVVADQEYPPRVAFALLNKLIDEYDKEQRGAWKTQTGPAQDWAPLTTAVADYQDPSKADKISAIQKELDDTTAVLSKTIENVLERGEKLDDLVSKSQDLSTQSKVFYKQAKKTNSCCVVM